MACVDLSLDCLVLSRDKTAHYIACDIPNSVCMILYLYWSTLFPVCWVLSSVCMILTRDKAVNYMAFETMYIYIELLFVTRPIAKT